MDKKEQFSTSSMPKLPSHRSGKTNLKTKDDDELWKKRKKQNPDLDKQVYKIGEKALINFHKRAKSILENL